MALPTMSIEDRKKALESAKAARAKRAALLKQVACGEVSVGQVLDAAETDECYARIKVSALLRAVPGYGEVRSSRLMTDLHIAESRRLRGLGVHQCEALRKYFA